MSPSEPRGVEAEAAARQHLSAAYRQFMSETDAEREGAAGKNLIRAIFGINAISEESD